MYPLDVPLMRDPLVVLRRHQRTNVISLHLAVVALNGMLLSLAPPLVAQLILISWPAVCLAWLALSFLPLLHVKRFSRAVTAAYSVGLGTVHQEFLPLVDPAFLLDGGPSVLLWLGSAGYGLLIFGLSWLFLRLTSRELLALIQRSKQLWA